MAIEGSRVAIVGGSIAGCAAAIALRRANCEVTIYERSCGELRDRGFGIALPVPLREELVSNGYLDPGMPVHRCSERLWLVRDTGGPGRQKEAGRVIWREPFPAVLNNWGILWRTLRTRVPDDFYRRPVAVTHIDADTDGATIVTADGYRDRFDMVVGADGYRSMTRRLVDAESRPAYAGYALWRGTYAESRLDTAAPQELEQGLVWVGFPQGHGGCYLIPDLNRGRRRMNWGVYSEVPLQLGFEHPTSLPPGSVGDELVGVLERILERHFPPCWAKVIRRTCRSELSLQPVYDATIPTYTSYRVMLIGDAGAVTRPHTGSGATKALQDALTLERACRDHRTWDGVLAAYDAERCPAGNALVELGKRLGKAQVEETPPWDSMTSEDFQAWMRATLDGRHTVYES